MEDDNQIVAAVGSLHPQAVQHFAEGAAWAVEHPDIPLTAFTSLVEAGDQRKSALPTDSGAVREL